jgi:hypothetical protein
MPHARHGGKGVREFAATGSKLDGTGLENEQMGQIHVTFDANDAAGRTDGEGLPWRAGDPLPRLEEKAGALEGLG